MKLTLEGIKDREPREKAGIVLPGYDVEEVSEKQKRNRSGYISASEIFSVYLSVVLQTVSLKTRAMNRGITCVEMFNYDVVDKIYNPYDNLELSVIMHGDGTREYKEVREAEERNLPKFSTVLIIIPVPLVLILCSTVSEYIPGIDFMRPVLEFLGTPFVALIIAVLLAMYFLGKRQGYNGEELKKILDCSLRPTGQILLVITGAVSSAGCCRTVAWEISSGRHWKRAIFR